MTGQYLLTGRVHRAALMLRLERLTDSASVLATVAHKVFAFSLLTGSSRPLTHICIREACVY